MADNRGEKRPDYDHLVKLLLIGDSGVGKSCLLLRFSEDDFNSSFVTTIGIDFKIKTISAQGKQLKLQIWDTAGQERFRTITSAYYRGAMGVLMVYDVGSLISFDNIRSWMRNVEQNASKTVNKILIGNKSDLMQSEREVPTERGAALAREFGIPFIETSAISGSNVVKAFETVAFDVVARLESDKAAAKADAHPVPEPSIRLGGRLRPEHRKKSNCC